jgi:hypothetical protein
MRAAPFASVSSALLEGVERLVVEEHRVLFAEALGQPWSPPVAYRWIRYEDPDPLGQLIAASERLDEEWGRHPEAAARRAAFRDWEGVELQRLARA